jgi:hypothetical protein
MFLFIEKPFMQATESMQSCCQLFYIYLTLIIVPNVVILDNLIDSFVEKVDYFFLLSLYLSNYIKICNENSKDDRFQTMQTKSYKTA